MQKYPFNIGKADVDVNVGLIGSGIQESRSPLMHVREAEAQGCTLNYQLFDLEQLDGDVAALPGLLSEIENAGYAGVNITHPCKQIVTDYLDELSADACDLGAVNTVIFKDGRRYGHNTDWAGFYLSFNQSLPDVATDKVLLLGAGGAGSAVAYALAKIGVKTVNIFDLDTAKAEVLINRMNEKFPNISFIIPDEMENIIATVDGIINTTPVGMKKYPGSPLPGELLSLRHWLADVIYFPLETELLRTARKIGCKAMNGSGMAIHQAAEAFSLFTGKPADIERMSQTFFNEF